MLTKTDLDTALSYYPKIAEQIKEVAGNRANLVKKRSQIAAKAAAEGKSAADAAKEAAKGTKDEDDGDSKAKEKPSAPAPQAAPTNKPAAAEDKDTGGNETTEQGEKVFETKPLGVVYWFTVRSKLYRLYIIKLLFPTGKCIYRRSTSTI